MHRELGSLHENFRRDSHEPLPSDRSLGFVFAGFCGLMAAAGLWKGSETAQYWVGGASIFLTVALAHPILLRPLNRLWMSLAKLMQRLVSPIALTLLFFMAIVPTGFMLKLCGKDILRLKFDREATTYWIERDSRVASGESMTNQF